MSSEKGTSDSSFDSAWSPANRQASRVQKAPASDEKILFNLGPYQILERIGKGGMGEVFRAYDPTCGRYIAIKKIRDDLENKSNLHQRFLREARITSQLAHPAVIPIYAIHYENNQLYYTMPYVAGETLHRILRNTLRREKKGEDIENSGGTIPTLANIFLKTCQAVAYAHSRGVLHRDIKPENIMVGQYGEVLILDWGLAKILGDDSENPTEESETGEKKDSSLTRLGKVVGTASYLPPERARGHSADVLSDVYALGVILYQILTLHLPFHRTDLKSFRENMDKEVFTEPAEVAPYRHVPDILASIAKRSLAPDPKMRYPNVETLINDVQGYLEGRSGWFPITTLDIHNREDWEFQENVFLADQIAVTRGADVSDWVTLMISKASFSENVRLEASLQLGDKSQGIGFLISVPEANERVNVSEGMCLWLSSTGSKLMRNAVEVMNAPGITLKSGHKYDVVIEKVDNTVHISLDGIEQFAYVSPLPLVGTHVGLLARDGDFEINDFTILVGSHTLQVNCLAIPDAFLAAKCYDKALGEYRRIHHAFASHEEGRDALYRSGITLVEQAKVTRKKSQATALYNQALEEFEQLHDTPSAPLEYLGKAMVYRALGNPMDELRCFELATRRYKKHPLRHLLQEQIVTRMHTASRKSRTEAYNFISLVVRHFPKALENPTTKHLIHNVEKHWEPLPFIQGPENNTLFSLILAFWLAKPLIIAEIIDGLDQSPILSDALFLLLELGSTKLAKEKMEPSHPLLSLACALRPANLKKNLEKAITSAPSFERTRVLHYMMEYGLKHNRPQVILDITSDALDKTFDSHRVWAHLLLKNWDAAGEILHQYPLDNLSEKSSLLHFLYGCWLHHTEGEEISLAHYSDVLEFLYPRSWTLASHYLLGHLEKNNPWWKESFLWERRQLYRQLSLYYICTGNEMEAKRFERLEKKQYVKE